MNSPHRASSVHALDRALSSLPAATRLRTTAGRPAVTAQPALPDPDTDAFLSSLAGPNGLDLVVELAHDLRSPLTSILFVAESLHQGQTGPVNEAQRRSLALIYSAALSLCTAASDVLELARGGRRLVDGEPQPFSVADVLISVRNMILPLALEKRLEVQLVHAIPERRLGHAHALSRVLLNLASNAVKFTESGTVEIRARPLAAGRLEFSVSDTGRGIEPDVLRNLYEPFRKKADACYHFSSAGLGLAICRKLVRAMGSELKIETGPRRGSRFFFAIDLPPAPAE